MSGRPTNTRTPACLESYEYSLIFEKMVNQGTQWRSRTALMSFTDQIANITKNGDPDCYLFTAKSAIPVADAVRGYYDAIDRQHPPLEIVQTGGLAYADSSEREAMVNEEADRLRPLISGLGRVSVVEQFVSSGDGLLLAETIVRRICPTIQTANFRNSNWYHDAKESDIDFDKISSTHEPFMHTVGIAAAERVKAGEYHDSPSLRLNNAAS